MKLPPSFDRGDATPEEREALFASLVVVLLAMREAGMVGASLRITDSPPAPFGRGARGPLVGVWQKVIGAKSDQDFGKETERLTLEWSKKVGFGERKMVEPAMWVVGVGVTVALGADGVTLPSGEEVTLRAAKEKASALILDTGPKA